MVGSKLILNPESIGWLNRVLPLQTAYVADHPPQTMATIHKIRSVWFLWQNLLIDVTGNGQQDAVITVRPEQEQSRSAREEHYSLIISEHGEIIYSGAAIQSVATLDVDGSTTLILDESTMWPTRRWSDQTRQFQ